LFQLQFSGFTQELNNEKTAQLGTVGLLTSALLDPLIYTMLDKPIPWLRDLLMLAGGIACFYLLIKHRQEF
jgi:hypothetical protein